ncbi:MAG: carbohydrate ABC transporter permease [Fusobacteriaceae bacterium]|jgi:raffinose/stachyose/melibiose transport system permease protein|nr:carbohydrate ABC transporter permease [Fusobacteriaceae bacterium]MBN2838409.1 carbohydrate ABC transporter permease [Fusobacteriaceae bacterium]
MKRKQNFKFILYIVGLFTSLLYVSPFYILIVNAFKTKKDLFESTLKLPAIWTFKNFETAATKLSLLSEANSFWSSSLFNSLFITIFSVIVTIIFTSMAAWMLVRTKSKVSTFIFFMFIAAMLVPFQAVMLPLVALAGKLAMQNRIGLIFMYLGFGSSLSIFLYHGFIKGLPISVEEAAIVDGCSPWQVFWKIVFPTLKPIHITVGALNVIAIWNDFLLPQLMINQKGMQTIPLKMFFFFGGYSKQWHLAMAGLLIAIIPVVIFYFMAQKHIIEGITAGANK